MKKIIITTMLAITFLVSPVIAGKRVRIYDENSHYVGSIQNGRIYDSNSHYRGRVEKSGRIYDEKSHYKGRLEKQKGNKKSRHEVEEEVDSEY